MSILGLGSESGSAGYSEIRETAEKEIEEMLGSSGVEVKETPEVMDELLQEGDFARAGELFQEWYGLLKAADAEGIDESEFWREKIVEVWETVEKEISDMISKGNFREAAEVSEDFRLYSAAQVSKYYLKYIGEGESPGEFVESIFNNLENGEFEKSAEKFQGLKLLSTAVSSASSREKMMGIFPKEGFPEKASWLEEKVEELREEAKKVYEKLVEESEQDLRDFESGEEKITPQMVNHMRAEGKDAGVLEEEIRSLKEELAEAEKDAESAAFIALKYGLDSSLHKKAKEIEIEVKKHRKELKRRVEEVKA